MLSKWFDIWWYKYLFKPRSTYYKIGRFKTLWCRLKNHPCGIIWYSSGFEPNYHCKNCGDELD